ncbi:MAG: MBL fold metallo-hydrolase [Pseudomonadota bacterium]
MNRLNARFLGVGNAGNQQLGSAALVIEHGHSAEHSVPLLLIDCGPDTLNAFVARYDVLPAALFITHTHLDHVGGLEQLFYRACFAPDGRRNDIRLFVPAPLVPHLHQRIADYPNNVAEGGVNFWDVLRIVPVAGHFWLQGLDFRVYPVRHHAPNSAFGLHLPGSFFYSGDTRPVPELMGTVAAHGELLFHDCGRRGNPSHTGLDDVLRDYDADVRRRFVAYHYASAEDAAAIRAAGLRTAGSDDLFPLPVPAPSPLAPLSH